MYVLIEKQRKFVFCDLNTECISFSYNIRYVYPDMINRMFISSADLELVIITINQRK